MLNVNNYIYTEAGIFSVNDLLNLQKNNVLLPKVLTFNTDKESSNYLTYYFTDINEIEEIPKVDIYEVRFVDVFSSRNIILNISDDTEIFQYNVLQTEDHPIINKNYQVIQYLKANIMRTKLNLKWIPIAELTNYANKSPNICMIYIVITCLLYTSCFLNWTKNRSFFLGSTLTYILSSFLTYLFGLK